MSSLFIISIVAVLVIAGLGYTLVFQTLDNKRKQQHRIAGALKQKAKNLDQMSLSFPDGFLSKELKILIFRCLVDVFEQLTKLEPKNPDHPAALENYKQLMTAEQAKNSQTQKHHFDNLQKIKDVRALLQDLHKFVERLMQKGTLSDIQARAYSKQIKILIVGASVDAYTINAKAATKENKPKLAIHHYDLARKLITKAGFEKTFQQQLAHLSAAMTELESKLPAEEPKLEEENLSEAANGEWANFQGDGADWKKKTVYD